MKIPWKIPWVVGSPKGGYSLKKTIQKKIGAMFVSFRECRKIGCSVTGKAVIFYHVDLFCTLALYAKKSLKSELHTVYLLLAMWECLWGSRCRLSGWSLPQLWRTQGVSLAIEWQLKSELKVLSVCPKNKASWYVWCIWSMKPSILLRFFLYFSRSFLKWQKCALVVLQLQKVPKMSSPGLRFQYFNQHELASWVGLSAILNLSHAWERQRGCNIRTVLFGELWRSSIRIKL